MQHIHQCTQGCLSPKCPLHCYVLHTRQPSLTTRRAAAWPPGATLRPTCVPQHPPPPLCAEVLFRRQGASKGGMNMLTKCMAVDHAADCRQIILPSSTLHLKIGLTSIQVLGLFSLSNYVVSNDIIYGYFQHHEAVNFGISQLTMTRSK